MKRQYYYYQGIYYALMKTKSINFKDGDAIFEVNPELGVITRLNYNLIDGVYWIGKWHWIESDANKITAAEFYAAAKKVLKY